MRHREAVLYLRLRIRAARVSPYQQQHDIVLRRRGEDTLPVDGLDAAVKHDDRQTEAIGQDPVDEGTRIGIADPRKF